jgi:GAF domain-containing protein
MARCDLDAALQLLTDRAQYITGASGAAIALRRDGKNDMLCRATTGSNAPELGALFSTEFGLSGESVRTRQPLRCDDAERDVRVNRDVCRQLGIASVVVMPVVNDDEVLGVFELFSERVNAFGERDLSAVRRLSEMVETAVRLAQAALNLPEQLRKNEISAPEVENEVENLGAPQDQVMTAEVLEDIVLEEPQGEEVILEDASGPTLPAAMESGVQSPDANILAEETVSQSPETGMRKPVAADAVAAELHQAQTEKIEVAQKEPNKARGSSLPAAEESIVQPAAVRIQSPVVSVPMQQSVRQAPEAETRKLAAETVAGLNQAQEDLLGKIEAAQKGTKEGKEVAGSQLLAAKEGSCQPTAVRIQPSEASVRAQDSVSQAPEAENPKPVTAESGGISQPPTSAREEVEPAAPTQPATPKKQLFWSSALNPAADASPEEADRSHVPPVLRGLHKCGSCGFPVSSGRVLCVECEEKKWRGQLRVPQAAGPTRPVATTAPVTVPAAENSRLVAAGEGSTITKKPSESLRQLQAGISPSAPVASGAVPKLEARAVAAAAQSAAVPVPAPSTQSSSAAPPALSTSSPVSASPIPSKVKTPLLPKTSVPVSEPLQCSTDFVLSAGLEPSQSWLSANRYVIGVLLVVGVVVGAFFLLR